MPETRKSTKPAITTGNHTIKMTEKRDSFLGLDSNSYSREVLGELNFLDAVPWIRYAQQILAGLNPEVIPIIGDRPVNKICGSIDKIVAVLQDMIAFDVSGPSPAQTRSNALSQLRDGVIELQQNIMIPVAYGAAVRVDWGNEQKLFSESIAKLKARLENSVTDAVLKAEADAEAVREVRDFAEGAKVLIEAQIAERVAEQQSSHFADAAATYNRISIAWLIGALLTGGLILTMSIGLIVVPILFPGIAKSILPTDPTAGQLVQALSGKVFVFGTLTFFLVMCARSFSASQHNATVNRHRANALNTFQAIMLASGNPDSKNAILVQAASCIFSPQPTGFSAGDASDMAVSRSVIEMVTGKAAPD